MDVPSPQVLLIPGEAVNQKFALQIALPPHLGLQQFDSDFARNYLALHHILVNQLALLGVLILTLIPQQITCRHVMQAISFLDELTLSALARPRTTQDEDDPGLLVLSNVGVGQHNSIYMDDFHSATHL